MTDRRLSVLHCIYDDPSNPWVGGGGAVRVREIYRRLADDVAVTVATGNYPGARDATVDGVDYVRLGARGPYAWSRATYARAATALLRDATYDAAVLDFSAYAPVPVPHDRPIGVTVHHLSGPTARARWGRGTGALVERVERGLLRRGRRFTVDADAMIAPLTERVVPNAPVDVVPAGVADDLFTVERQPQDYLLCLGRLDIFQKGIDTLLAAMAMLVRDRPQLGLRIAGRGRDAERIRAMTHDLDIAHNVRVLGAVSDDERRTLLASATLQVMPSRFEGFGMAAAEAMAAGVPLVATTAGALPEVIGPEGGVLVAPDDPSALALAIAHLLDDPEARTRLSGTARVSAERFRWTAIARRHLDFLHRVASD